MPTPLLAPVRRLGPLKLSVMTYTCASHDVGMITAALQAGAVKALIELQAGMMKAPGFRVLGTA
jgi:hypothetical protein